MFLTGYCGYSKAECVGETYRPATEIGTAFTINSATQTMTLLEIDSTFCKVHQHAAAARKILGNQAIGVSHGGKNTKIHALVTENFQLIGLLLTGRSIHDSQCAIELLSKVNLDDKTVLGDNCHSLRQIALLL